MATFTNIDRFLNNAKPGDKCVNLNRDYSDNHTASCRVNSTHIAFVAAPLEDGSGMHFKGSEFKERIEETRFGPFDFDFTLHLVKSVRGFEYTTKFAEDFDEPCEILEENLGEWMVYEKIENPFD